MGLKLVGKQSGGIKLVPIEGPVVPGYSQGFVDGIGAVFGLWALIEYYFEGCGVKEMGRLLLEVTNPGRNSDGTGIKTPI